MQVERARRPTWDGGSGAPVAPRRRVTEKARRKMVGGIAGHPGSEVGGLPPRHRRRGVLRQFRGAALQRPSLPGHRSGRGGDCPLAASEGGETRDPPDRRAARVECHRPAFLSGRSGTTGGLAATLDPPCVDRNRFGSRRLAPAGCFAAPDRTASTAPQVEWSGLHRRSRSDPEPPRSPPWRNSTYPGRDITNNTTTIPSLPPPEWRCWPAGPGWPACAR